jgi:hypothetical protein
VRFLHRVAGRNSIVHRLPSSVRRVGLVAVLALAAGVAVGGVQSHLAQGGTELSPPLNVGSSLAYLGDTPTPTSWIVQAKDASRVSLVPSPGRDGSAIRLQVLPGDTEVAGSSSQGDRADVYIPSATTDGQEGREQWWAWSTMFPEDAYHLTPGTAWNLFLDFHQTGDTGQPNLSLLVNDHFKVPMLEMTVYGGKPNAGGKGFLFSPLWQNMWLDFVLHVTWSSNPQVGFVELFMDGRLAVPKTRMATLYDGQGVYLKLANYRAASSEASTILHAGVRRASSYAEAIKGFPKGKWPATPQTRSWRPRIEREG